jgi:hypothetical protein
MSGKVRGQGIGFWLTSLPDVARQLRSRRTDRLNAGSQPDDLCTLWVAMTLAPGRSPARRTASFGSDGHQVRLSTEAGQRFSRLAFFIFAI